MANIFLADENVDGLAIEIALSRHVQIIPAIDVGLSRMPDQQIFTYALEHGTAIITGNIADFTALAAAHQKKGGKHHGLVLIKGEHQKNSALIAEMLQLLESENLIDHMEWI
jgi:hypothetical protein